MTKTQQLEKTLWAAADKLRNNMDAAEYKHVVLGLIFLKYISDAFEELHNALLEGKGDYEGADPEDPDEYRGENVFFVPVQARWKTLQDRAKQPTIGKDIDDAMDAVERDNPSIKGVLSKIYARPSLDKQKLGELVDLISNVKIGDKESQGKDLLGQVYEYFLGRFADAEGKRGGQFYTDQSVVKLMVEMLTPFEGRVYDPACGSGGMFVHSEKFVEEHGGKHDSISIWGQESNPTTWRLAKMNLAIRGIDANIGLGDTFGANEFKDEKFDYILANPPFNISDWGGEHHRSDARWIYGVVPPVGNANYAWLMHMIYHLKPQKGFAATVMANGSMSSNTATEGELRKQMIENDVVDCMVALPSQLFFNTQIPVCLWFMTRSKTDTRFRNRANEVLFIDARELGEMESRKKRTLSETDISKIADTYHQWRNKPDTIEGLGGPGGTYEDIAGFCRSATTQDIRKNNHILTPGRYVGFAEEEDDGIPFEEKMAQLTKELGEQFEASKKLEEEIRNNLKGIGYEF